MGDKLWLLCPGNKGTSDAFRSGWERIWKRRKGDVAHEGSKPLRMASSESRRLEHFSKHSAYEQDV
jgi:hypothetical protein